MFIVEIFLKHANAKQKFIIIYELTTQLQFGFYILIIHILKIVVMLDIQFYFLAF